MPHFCYFTPDKPTLADLQLAKAAGALALAHESNGTYLRIYVLDNKARSLLKPGIRANVEGESFWLVGLRFDDVGQMLCYLAGRLNAEVKSFSSGKELFGPGRFWPVALIRVAFDDMPSALKAHRKPTIFDVDLSRVPETQMLPRGYSRQLVIRSSDRALWRLFEPSPTRQRPSWQEQTYLGLRLLTYGYKTPTAITQLSRKLMLGGFALHRP